VKKFSLLLLAILLVAGCQQKQPIASGKAIKQDVTAKPFIPPADSSIVPSQMKTWLSCNGLLDSLTYMYADSFKTTDTGKRLKYQEDFSKAQDRICVIAGLQGGYKEYRWIFENMGSSRNKHLLDSFKVMVTN
jgi:hypothetical protein